MERNLKIDVKSQSETNILGYEKIGKLLKMYAIPSIISMLVNALYNIVDQIYIWEMAQRILFSRLRLYLLLLL